MPGWGRGNSTRLPPGAGAGIPGAPGVAAPRLYRRRRGDSVPSAASLRTSANSSSVPIVPSVRRIEGFEPCRDELIFERKSPSCYSREAFTALVNRSRGGIVLAGFAGESACLSTLIDAFHRNHKVTYLCDASASHALDEMPAGDVHRAVSKIPGICAEVFETDDWIEQTLPRNLGYGKNAGG